MKRLTHPKITLAVLAAAVVAVTATAVPAEASSEGSDCATWRSYGFIAESIDPASAGVVGHVNLVDTDQGSQSYTLEVTEKMARYMREATAGGCTIGVNVPTRGTTGTLGIGSTAEYSGTVTVGGAASGGVTDSGAHPLSVCPNTLICQEDIEHWLPASEMEGGDVVTINANGTATAQAGGTTTIHQATASWRVRHPALVIPIP